MDGILSPDGESVLHESMWIEAILSPDESMYFHEGEWYSLDQEASSATSVRRATRLRRPEVTEVTVIHDEDNQGIALGGTAIIALGLLWLIFDSGKIISYAELAMMNCSTWSEFDSSSHTDIGGSCVTANCNGRICRCFSLLDGYLLLIGKYSQVAGYQVAALHGFE